MLVFIGRGPQVVVVLRTAVVATSRSQQRTAVVVLVLLARLATYNILETMTRLFQTAVLIYIYIPGSWRTFCELLPLLLLLLRADAAAVTRNGNAPREVTVSFNCCTTAGSIRTATYSSSTGQPEAETNRSADISENIIFVLIPI